MEPKGMREMGQNWKALITQPVSRMNIKKDHAALWNALADLAEELVRAENAYVHLDGRNEKLADEVDELDTDLEGLKDYHLRLNATVVDLRDKVKVLERRGICGWQLVPDGVRCTRSPDHKGEHHYE